MKNNKLAKIIKRLIAVLLCVVIVLAGAAVIVWHNEIRSAASLRLFAPADPDHKDGAIYRMEISGGYYFDEFLAQGGVTNDADLIDFITKHITKGLINMGIETSEIACSSFTGTLPDGDRIFARNYDMYPTNTCIVYTNPGNGRHASYSTIDLEFIGIGEDGVNGIMDRISCLAAPYVPLDGVNDAGLSCGIYMTYQGDGDTAYPTDVNTTRPDLTSTTMLRMILDYASTVDEAIEMISGYDLHDSAATSFHYMIADAQGNSAVLEWVGDADATDTDGNARHLSVIRNDADTLSGVTDWQMLTNFIIVPDYYDNEEDMYGLDRYEHLREALAERNGNFADEADAMSLLAEVGRRTWNPDNNGVTVHSVIYNLEDLTVLWVGNEHYGEPEYTLELKLK